MNEDVNISEGTGSWVWVEIGDEGPAFEDDEFDVVLLECCKERCEMVFVKQVVGDGLELIRC